MASREKTAFTTILSKGRLEFLFDGVFAIALTILVLELKLPEIADRRSAGELGRALLHHWRTFLSYIISFMILSGFWIGHNTLYARLARVTKAILAIHVWLLIWAAFIPFCAHLLGRYPGNPAAHAVYLATAFAYSAGLLALVVTAERQEAFDAAVSAADVRRLRRGLTRPLVALLFVLAYSLFVMPNLK
jgi:uncharacterized membrane protein